MRSLVKFFRTMAVDKRKHVVAGLVLGAFGALIGAALGGPPALLGLAAGAAGGLVKEFHDHIFDGVVDKADFLHTAVASLPTAILIHILVA